MKYETVGRKVVVTFNDGERIEFDTERLPEVSHEFALMRGARKILSDVLAGFEGTDEQAKKATVDKWQQLENGVLRQAVTVIPTPDQLAFAFRLIANTDDESAIWERVKQWHPDFAPDKRERGRRMRALKERMNGPKLSAALFDAGFTVTVRDADDMLEGL